jgi:hypothetical protein
MTVTVEESAGVIWGMARDLARPQDSAKCMNSKKNVEYIVGLEGGGEPDATGHGGSQGQGTQGQAEAADWAGTGSQEEPSDAPLVGKGVLRCL